MNRQSVERVALSEYLLDLSTIDDGVEVLDEEELEISIRSGRLVSSDGEEAKVHWIAA